MPEFSVIIPVYNVAPYLRACLDSVLSAVSLLAGYEARKGTRASVIELICVDDGSTDGSADILEMYSRSIEQAGGNVKFVVLHQRNGGVSSARNAALEIASGDWIVFVDGDDVIHEKLFCAISRSIKCNPNDDLFRFGVYVFDDGACPSWGEIPDIDEITFSRIRIDATIEFSDFFDYFFCCYVYRRSILDGLRFPQYVRGEDRCLLAQVQLHRATSIISTDCIFYGYRRRAGSAMNSEPNTRVMRDELSHRVAIIKMIEESEKNVDYKGKSCFEGYFVYGFVQQIRNRNDYATLHKEWMRCLSELCSKAKYSLSGRLMIWCWMHQPFSVIPRVRYFFIPYLKSLVRNVIFAGKGLG